MGFSRSSAKINLMHEAFAQKLAVGGKKNSLGLTEQVVQAVLQNKARLPELYGCLLNDNAWIRMRAADGLEKICRVHPEWFEPLIDQLFADMGASTQPSLQWHFAQMLGEIKLTPTHNRAALEWLKNKLKTVDVDWITSANAMTTLVQFAKEKRLSKPEVLSFLQVQHRHASSAVRKRAQKLLDELYSTVPISEIPTKHIE